MGKDMRGKKRRTKEEHATSNRLILISLALTPVLFVFDIATQRGAATALLYIFPLLLSLQSKRNEIYLWFPLYLTVFTVVGAFFKPPSEVMTQTIVFNRALVIISLWIITMLVRKRNNADALVYTREKEYRTLTENLPDIVIQLDKNLRYQYLNPEALRQTGKPKEAYLGKTLREIIADDNQYAFWIEPIEKVLATGKTMEVEYALPHPREEKAYSGKIVPIQGPGKMIGSVLLVSRDVTERRRTEQQIRYLSFHDEVTDLFNRAFFEEELRRINTERDLPISIIMGDVNYLKLSNDVFGHDEGDKLLKTIAAAIKRACRTDDIVARWGGDEFAVILPKTDHLTVNKVSCRIKQTAEESEGTVICPSIALGVGTKERKNQNIYGTIRQAEQSMYDNKLAESEQNAAIIISSLLKRAGKRAQNLHEHIRRAHALARRFGEKLALEEDQMKALLLLVEMHDIGMALVPREILTKPGQLSKEEWELVKKHSEAGFRIVTSFPDTVRISDEVLSHGERWDGTGYPRKLKGKEIPYMARILAVIDAYDVMTHPRVYARTFSHEEAIEELRRNAGKQFDPEIIEKFFQGINEAAVPANSSK